MKLYEKILKLLNEVLIFIPIILIVCFSIKIPCYIEGVGGITNLNKKISIEDEYKSKGSINSLYVTEYKSNVLTYLMALINPNMDIYEIEDYLLPNETYQIMNYRNKLKLRESLDNAIIYGYNKAGVDINIKSTELYVTYVLNPDTDLEVGDRIIKINDIDINNVSIDEILSNLESDTINIEVNNNGKNYLRYAKIIDIEGDKYIGIILTTLRDYELGKELKFKTNSKESGPSAGLMLALEIYNKLTSNDITKGAKIVGTGTIDILGKVGAIGGIKYKVKAAIKAKADILFVPMDNYEEALTYNNGKLNIIGVSSFDEAIDYLNNN